MKKIVSLITSAIMTISSFNITTAFAEEPIEHQHTWIESSETIHHDAEYATKTTWYLQRWSKGVDKGTVPPGPNKYFVDYSDSEVGRQAYEDFTDYYDLLCWYYGSLENVPKKWMRFMTIDNYEAFGYTYDEFMNLCPAYDFFGNKNPKFNPEHDVFAIYNISAPGYAVDGPGGIVELGLGVQLLDYVITDLDGNNQFFPAAQEQVIDKEAYDEIITHHICDICNESYDTSEIITIPTIIEPVTTTTITTNTITTTTTTTVTTEYTHIHEDLEKEDITDYMDISTEVVHHDAVNTTKTIWLYDFEWIENLPKGTIPEGPNKYHLDYHDNILGTFTDLYDIYCWYYGSLDNIPEDKIISKFTLENCTEDYFYTLNNKKDHFGNYHPEVGKYDEFYTIYTSDALDEALYGDNSIFEKFSKYAHSIEATKYTNNIFDSIDDVCYYYPVAQEPVIIDAYDEKVTHYFCKYCKEKYDKSEKINNIEPIVTTTTSSNINTTTSTTTTSTNSTTQTTVSLTTPVITTTNIIEEKYIPVYGDVNCDNTVNIKDVVMLNRYLNNTITLSNQAKINADCYNPQNISGKAINADTVEITEEDTTAILKCIVHLNTLPIIDTEVIAILSNTEGDINNDSTLNISDVVTLQSWLLGMDVKLSNWKAADLCEDNQLNVYDLCIMKRKLINS